VMDIQQERRAANRTLMMPLESQAHAIQKMEIEVVKLQNGLKVNSRLANRMRTQGSAPSTLKDAVESGTADPSVANQRCSDSKTKNFYDSQASMLQNSIFGSTRLEELIR
jgi:hypothetical protein